MAEKTDLRDLLPAYLARRKDDVILLCTSVELRDFATVQRVGHKLGGNGGTFGFARISEIGRDLESAAIAENIPKIQEHTRELIEYLQAIPGQPAHLEGG